MKDPDRLGVPHKTVSISQTYRRETPRLRIGSFLRMLLAVSCYVVACQFRDNIFVDFIKELSDFFYIFYFILFIAAIGWATPKVVCDLIEWLSGNNTSELTLPLEIRFYTNCMVVYRETQDNKKRYEQVEYDAIRALTYKQYPQRAHISGFTKIVEFRTADSEHTHPKYGTGEVIIIPLGCGDFANEVIGEIQYYTKMHGNEMPVCYET